MATKFRLTMLGSANDAVRPILDGTIEIEGVDLEWVDPESEALTRRPSPEAFGLLETSLVSYLTGKDQGSNGWLIPVFPARRFAHTELAAPTNAGIKTPADLAGKRVGVGSADSTSTGGLGAGAPSLISDSAALWTRAALEHDHSVAGANVQILGPDKDPVAALTTKEVDAATIREPVANVQPIFSNPIEEGARYFKAHGFVPAESTYVLNAQLYAEQPWIAFNVYKAFLLAKDVAQQRLARAIPSGLIFGADYLRRTRQLFGDDPAPDGVRRNRAMLEAALDYAQEQGLTKAKARIEDLVPPQLTEF